MRIPEVLGVRGSVSNDQFRPPLRVSKTPESRPPATMVLASSGSKATSVGCTYPWNCVKLVAPAPTPVCI